MPVRVGHPDGADVEPRPVHVAVHAAHHDAVPIAREHGQRLEARCPRRRERVLGEPAAEGLDVAAIRRGLDRDGEAVHAEDYAACRFAQSTTWAWVANQTPGLARACRMISSRIQMRERYPIT